MLLAATRRRNYDLPPRRESRSPNARQGTATDGLLMIRRKRSLHFEHLASAVATAIRQEPDPGIMIFPEFTSFRDWQGFALSLRGQVGNLDHLRVFVASEYCGLSWDHPQSHYYGLSRAFFPHAPRASFFWPGDLSASSASCWAESFASALSSFGPAHVAACCLGPNGELGHMPPPYDQPETVVHRPLDPVAFDEKACFFERFKNVPRCIASAGVPVVRAAGLLAAVCHGQTAVRTRWLESACEATMGDRRVRFVH